MDQNITIVMQTGKGKRKKLDPTWGGAFKRFGKDWAVWAEKDFVPELCNSKSRKKKGERRR